MRTLIEPPVACAPVRRRLLLGAAASAVLAVTALAWWGHEDGTRAVPVEQLVPGFWELQWDTPEGKRILMRNFQGHPLLLNFWATWCPPCVKELPLLNAFFRQYQVRGWQVLGLAIDQKEAVNAFLKTMELDFPVALAGAAGLSLSRSLGNLSGSLPFTLVLSKDAGIVQRKMGGLSIQDLDLLQHWGAAKS